MVEGCSGAEIAALRASVAGELVKAAAESFDHASILRNGLRNGCNPEYTASQPVLYLRAANEQDVVSGVKFALDEKLKLAFRGGGHHVGGIALCPSGMTIDLQDLKHVVADRKTGIARFQAGLTSSELCRATEGYGLHYRVAHVGSVGVAGFTLGGGQGWGGLACDQIIAMDVLNIWEYPKQELTIKRIDASSEPELFLAMQGAGNMLGVVIAFHAQLQPIPKGGLVRSAAAMWPLAQAQTASETLDDYIAQHSSEQSTRFVERSLTFVTIPIIGSVAMISLTDWSPDGSTGTSAFMDGWLAAAAAAGAKAMDSRKPYLDQINSLSAALDYPGVTSWATSFYIASENMPVAAEVCAESYADVTSPRSAIVRGNIPPNNHANGQTAYAWRGYNAIYIYALWTRTADGVQADGDAAHIAWAKGVAERLQLLAAGRDVNVITFEDAGETRSCYPSKWQQVLDAKAKYDPYSLLRELDFHYQRKLKRTT